MSVLAIAAGFAAIIAVPGAAGAQVLMERNVSAKMALAIAETALAECGSQVSVAVVDRSGRTAGALLSDTVPDQGEVIGGWHWRGRTGGGEATLLCACGGVREMGDGYVPVPACAGRPLAGRAHGAHE
jgi:hypothetical protein